MTLFSRRSSAGASFGLALLAGLLGLLVLTGCDSKTEDKGAEAPPKTAEGDAKSNPKSSAPELNTTSTGKKTVAIISPAKTSEFHNELPKGAAEEAKAVGWNPIIDQAPSKEDDYAGQVALAQNIVQQHPDAISVCGINPQALNTIIKKANEAKIPIFVHNQITKTEGDVVAYIGYDEREGGKLCGQQIAELLKQKNSDYKGKVAILDGEPGDHTNERAGGFKDALKKYPNIQIVAEQNGKWDRAEGNKITKDWLQKYPDLDVVFGCSDAMAQGASKAGADAQHKLITIGIDGNSTALLDVDAGKLTATLAVQPRAIGKKIIDTMQDYFADPSKVPAGTVIKTDMKIVTKENVRDFANESKKGNDQ
ncbi:MAG TPA: sugar ABC transporter substrate-binding protein [Chthonomonadaceae bacterium]|nr:sugar ABC transporter substrate-binding protein [Chthonomonadaceae bacterium]